MHRSDDLHPERDPDRDAERVLAVVDATLAGEAVEPADAELAELTLILAGQRPVPSPAFSAKLDRRVASRFAAPGASGVRPRRRKWLYAPGAAVGLAAGVAVAIVLSAGSPGGVSSSSPGTAAAGASSSASSAAPTLVPDSARSTTSAAASSSAQRSAPPSAKAPASSGETGPTPPTSGRQVVQSAQLSLSTRPDRVDDVAQQVFNVISAQHGVVQNSTVTADNSSSGYAQFQLSVPSANLQPTMAALSQLRGAAVASRTDASQDVTGELGGAGRRLADARALRTSLLRRLAAATTATEVSSLQAQIRDAEASISSDLATLNSLHHKVDFTQITLAINASLAPGHPASDGGSFTIGKAAHEAGRVLVVAAGVALIALAVLLPLGLVAALLAWVAMGVRRRRREHALDLI